MILKIGILSNALLERGGGSKAAGVTWQHLDRTRFDPYLITELVDGVFQQAYSVPPDRLLMTMFNDVARTEKILAGFDVVLMMVGTANNENEYLAAFEAAERAGVGLRALWIVFGLGEGRKADLFLCHSMDVFLNGQPRPGAYVTYPPLPRHAQVESRSAFRARHGISEDAWVVGYACSQFCPEFYDAVKAFRPRSDTVFLSALAKAEWSAPGMVFTKGLHQWEMASLYDASDVVLHARTESYGYSVHQALAAGKPVVALWTSSLNAFGETIYPLGGYLARDPEGLAAALEHMYQHREEASDRGKVGLRRASRLYPEIQVPALEAILWGQFRARLGLSAPSIPVNHWPGGAEITQWRRSRAEIKEKLKGSPFF